MSQSFWDGAVTVDLPAGLEWSEDEEGTIVLWFDSSPLTFRLSLLSFKAHDPQPGLGRKHVREDAAARGIDPVELENTTVLAYDESTDEQGEQVAMRYWMIGGHDRLAILSATMLESERQTPAGLAGLSQGEAIAHSLVFSQRYDLVETDSGVIPVSRDTLDPPAEEPSVREPSADDRAAITQLVTLGKALLEDYAPGGGDIFKRLDKAYAAWSHADPATRVDPDTAIDAFGAVFGDALNRACGSQWRIITDQYGTSLAVRHAKQDATAFPLDSVRKRFEDNEIDFFAAIRVMFQKMIDGEVD